MLKEHDTAILTIDLDKYHLKAGDIGTVVAIYDNGEGYEIEFFTASGQTLDVITVDGDSVRPVGKREILHARPLD